jgi:methionyl-tRNA formyltransferase
MNVLVLSPYPERIGETLRRTGDRVIATDGPIDVGLLRDLRIQWAVSYDYRHILGREIVEAIDGRIINLHISVLPWNRGSDPNFWSFFEDTPKGVTIHRIDAGIDTGDILARRRVRFGADETLASTYDRLQVEIEALFGAVWGDIRAETVRPRKQSGSGSHHRRRDKEIFMRLLPGGWNTPVATVERLGRDWRRTAVRVPSLAPNMTEHRQ